MTSFDMLHALRRPALTVGGVVVVLGVLTACGGDETKVDLGDGKSATVQEDGDKVTVKTDEGEISTGKGVKLPEGFPTDLPMPQAEYSIVSAVSNGDEQMIMLEVGAGLDLEAEYGHARAEAEKSGWSVDQHTIMDQGNAGQAILELTKDGKKAGYVISVSEGEPGAVLINVGSTD